MTQRREFLRQASLIAAGSLAAGSVEAQGATTPVPSPAQAAKVDMSWVDRVTGKYKMVYDAPEVKDGVSLHQVRSFLSGYRDVYGLADSDVTAVLTIRHAAVPMLLGDELWSDGAFGEKESLKDPESGEPTKRNPFINVPAGARFALTWPDGALDTLISRGVIVLACDLALNNVSGQIASRRNIPRPEARQLITDHLIKGVYRMPSGIFATSHAQILGCGMMYAG